MDGAKGKAEACKDRPEMPLRETAVKGDAPFCRGCASTEYITAGYSLQG